jgi:hypothetical protein
MTRTPQDMNKLELRDPYVEGGLEAMTNALLPHCGSLRAAEMRAPPVWRRASRVGNAKVADRRSPAGSNPSSSALAHQALENAHGMA